MSCSIRRFKSDSCPEKPINTENSNKLNNDLAKMLEERNKMDTKYYPTIAMSERVATEKIMIKSNNHIISYK